MKVRHIRRNYWYKKAIATAAAIGLLFMLCYSVEDSFCAETASQTHEIEIQGITYKFEGIPISNSKTKEFMYYVGRITFVNDKKNEIFYYENTAMSPGCGKFPILSRLEGRFVQKGIVSKNKKYLLIVYCGSSSGRHQSIKVFHHKEGFGVSSASLDFYDTHPNIKLNSESGEYISYIYRRDIIHHTYGGGIYFLYAYSLHVDENTISFIPTFGSTVSERYTKFYHSILKKKIDYTKFPKRIAPAIAALIATKNSDLICTGISEIEKRGMDVQKVNELVQLIPSFGYPHFNLSVCDGDRR